MNLFKLVVNLFITVFLPEHQNDLIFPLFDVLDLVGQTLGLSQQQRVKSTYAMSVSSATPTEDTIQMFGYPLEIHEVISDDGYKLTLHRIPHSKYSAKEATKKPPMVIVPGLFGDSFFFLAQGENNSPAFIISDAGYDVWLVNNRGTRYSRKHVTLNPDTQKEFWDFSFQEMGVRDMPAIVKYVLFMTNAPELYLCGHSMGGAIIPIFLVENPTLSQKVKAAFLLAPAFRLGRTKVPLIKNFQPFVYMFLTIFNDMEIGFQSSNSSHDSSTIILDICGNASFVRPLCNLFFWEFIGSRFDAEPDSFLEHISRAGAGASVKTIYHFLQMVSKKDFSSYDYGPEGNLLTYGQDNPPEYNLSSIRVPVWLLYTDNDTMVPAEDTVEASAEFGNLIGLVSVKIEPNTIFSHVDFGLSNDVKHLVCDPMLTQMSMLEAESSDSYLNVLTFAQLIFIYLIVLAVLALLALVTLGHYVNRSKRAVSNA